MIKELCLQALMVKYMCELDPKKAPKKQKSSSKSRFPGLLGRRILFNKTQNSWHGKNLMSVSQCVNFHSDKLRAPKKPTAKKIALISESAAPGAVREATAAADKIDDLQLRMLCNSELLHSLNDKLQLVLSGISPLQLAVHMQI